MIGPRATTSSEMDVDAGIPDFLEEYPEEPQITVVTEDEGEETEMKKLIPVQKAKRELW